MAASFDLIKDRLIDVEGGYVNDPLDAGGETKYGISKRQYPFVDIKNLTVKDASIIYERDFWKRFRMNEIASQAIAEMIFLAIINIGNNFTARLVQEAVTECGIRLKIDGVLGSVSINAINTVHAPWLRDRIAIRLCDYYLDLVDRNRSQERFLRGWLRRVIQ